MSSTYISFLGIPCEQKKMPLFTLIRMNKGMTLYFMKLSQQQLLLVSSFRQ